MYVHPFMLSMCADGGGDGGVFLHVFFSEQLQHQDVNKKHLTAEWVMPVMPDMSLWPNTYTTVMFDKDPAADDTVEGSEVTPFAVPMYICYHMYCDTAVPQSLGGDRFPVFDRSIHACDCTAVKPFGSQKAIILKSLRGTQQRSSGDFCAEGVR